MTEEELDLIASAYVDGEATPEEVAMVERDPDMAVRVEEIRSLSQQLSAPISVPTPAMKEQHLAAALGEFTAAGNDSAPAPPTVKVDRDSLVDRQGPGAEPAPTQRSNVIDLAGRSKSGGSKSAWSESDTPKTFPRWLSAAAAVVVIGGGAIFLANQVGSGDDAGETATADFATEETEAADAAGEASSRAESEFDQEAADESGEEDAMEEEAMEEESIAGLDDNAMDDAAADGDESSSAEAPATTSVQTVPAEPDAESADSDDAEADSSGGGFFPNEPAMSFETPPDIEQALEDMPERRDDLFRSTCNDEVLVPDGSQIIAFLPIEVAGEPAELFVLEASDGTETGVILDAACSEM